MSRSPSPSTPVEKINKSSPAAAEVSLGTMLEEAVAALNALRADHNTLIAKLNLDAGVTDVNYAASTASSVALLSAR